MTTRRLLVGAATIAAVATAAACNDTSLTGIEPSGAPRAAMRAAPATSATPVVVSVVRRVVPLPADVVDSITLQGRGGVLRLAQAGLTVEIPASALPDPSRPLTITVKALGGDQLAYEFGPHGTQFRTPIRLTQDVRGLRVAERPAELPKSTPLVASYFKTQADLDASAGTARTYEERPLTFNAARGTASFSVWHFSGYTVGWSRKGGEGEATTQARGVWGAIGDSLAGVGEVTPQSGYTVGWSRKGGEGDGTATPESGYTVGWSRKGQDERPSDRQ